MGEILKTIVDEWGSGVITSMEADAVPPNAYTKGLNVELASVGGGKAVVRKRFGCRTLNATQVTGASAIIGLYEFKRRTGSSYANHDLIVSDNGRLDKVSTSGTLTTISATAFTSSTTQEHLPSFATANNCCFIVNGQEAKKYDGTSLTNFGITQPSSAPTLADSGVAGNHNGTYEAFVTYVNSSTGAESSAGTTSGTVTVSSKKIDWTSIPVSADAQVDARRLYIRNTATQSYFYFVAEIADNSTTTYQSNLADSSLTDIGPDDAENDPPPSGVKYIAWHHGRMFVADDVNLYYSNLPDADGVPHPEAFDEEAIEPVNPDDGQRITGIYSAYDVLVIWKTSSMYVLVGDDPDSWSLRLIDPTVGCVAHRSISFAGNNLYWWGEQGPAVWDGSSTPDWIAPPLIDATIDPSNISFDPTYTRLICSSEDFNKHRLMWALPGVSQTRNTIILPWSHRLRRWESDGWDPMDASALGSFEDSNGQPFVILGGYAGQTFRWRDASTDGVDTATTMTGTFVASGSSVTTVTDAGASFDTTGGKLTERKVTIVDSDGIMVGTARPRITSNTGTAFTMNVAVEGLTDGNTYTYYIGGPAVDWYSAWLLQNDSLMKKRFMFAYVQLRPATTIDNVLVDTYVNYNLTPTAARTQTFDVDIDSGIWDESDWDVALWDSSAQVTKRFRIGRTGISFLLRLRHYAPNADFDLTRIGLISESLSERLG